MSRSYSNLGVALGGGATYGATHIGVLKAFEEKGINPEYILGTSIGAYVRVHTMHSERLLMNLNRSAWS